MCDTLMALGDATATHEMLFGKNSDRQRNEAQGVELIGSADHPPGATVQCTYLTLPQVRRTHSVLLCRPFWMWGAEMGANEHGVVIGNEGLIARSPAPQEPALTGMDLLRLGLERSASAIEALKTITDLLEQFGQGGNCGHRVPAFYNNGFLIADATEGFVLETVGREWLIERVRETRSISNEYSIAQVEGTSGGLDRLVREFGWDAREPPNYSAILPDPQRAHINSARSRQARSTSLMLSGHRQLRASHVMRILRDHDSTGTGEPWDPAQPHKYSLCIHAGADEVNSQTTGALVSEVGVKHAVHWVTGSSAPCISIFKPVLMDAPLPAHGPFPTDRYDERTLWWRHERLYRKALTSHFPSFIEEIKEERDALEADFCAKIRTVVTGASQADRAQVVSACWRAALAAEDRWATRMISSLELAQDAYFSMWHTMSQHAGVPK